MTCLVLPAAVAPGNHQDSTYIQAANYYTLKNKGPLVHRGVLCFVFVSSIYSTVNITECNVRGLTAIKRTSEDLKEEEWMRNYKINSRLNTCMSASAATTLLPVDGLYYKLVSELDYECSITFSTHSYGNTLTCA